MYSLVKKNVPGRFASGLQQSNTALYCNQDSAWHSNSQDPHKRRGLHIMTLQAMPVPTLGNCTSIATIFPTLNNAIPTRSIFHTDPTQQSKIPRPWLYFCGTVQQRCVIAQKRHVPAKRFDSRQNFNCFRSSGPLWFRPPGKSLVEPSPTWPQNTKARCRHCSKPFRSRHRWPGKSSVERDYYIPSKILGFCYICENVVLVSVWLNGSPSMYTGISFGVADPKSSSVHKRNISISFCQYPSAGTKPSSGGLEGP